MPEKNPSFVRRRNLPNLRRSATRGGRQPHEPERLCI